MSVRQRFVFSRLIHIRGIRSVAFILVTAGAFLAIALSLRLAELNRVDLAVTQWLQAHRSPTLDALFFTATFLGNSITLCGLALIASLLLLREGKRRAAFAVMLSLLALPFNELLKQFVDRPRPPEDVVHILLPRTGFSFPSGHSSASTVVFGFLAVLVWLSWKEPDWRRIASTAVLAIVPLLIAMSRVYVGAHWLSDVVAGLAMGAFLLGLLTSLYKSWHSGESRDS